MPQRQGIRSEAEEAATRMPVAKATPIKTPTEPTRPAATRTRFEVLETSNIGRIGKQEAEHARYEGAGPPQTVTRLDFLSNYKPSQLNRGTLRQGSDSSPLRRLVIASPS